MKYPTRQDYMAKRVSHREFYGALAREAGISFTDSLMLPRIRDALAAGDEHLNSIPLQIWDSIAYAQRRVTAPVLGAHGDYWSLGGGVCIAKEAARIAVEE